jgi:hypothetical protein
MLPDLRVYANRAAQVRLRSTRLTARINNAGLDSGLVDVLAGHISVWAVCRVRGGSTYTTAILAAQLALKAVRTGMPFGSIRGFIR